MLRHRRKHRRLFGLPALATGIGVVGMTALMAVPAQAASASTSTSRSQPGTTVATTAQRQALTRDGTVNLTNLAQQASNQPNAEGPHRTHEVPLGPSPYARRNPHATANEPRATAQQASAATALSGNVAGEHGFTGLTAPDNAAVNGGLDVTPPDQGLAVGPSPAGTAVAEILNDVLAVYSPSGKALLGAVPAYSLFNLPSSAFLSDPRAYYDAPTHRWFFTMFTVGTVSPSGTVTSPSTQYIAVSQTSDVFGSYAVFSFDTTDQGQAGCPCFGDFDMIGADSNGFYITTNEFSISGTAYNGAHIYAVSKSEIEAAAARPGSTAPELVLYRVPTDPFGQTYHISPAKTPQGAPFRINTEYFVESQANYLNGLALEVYALTQTYRLNSGGIPTLHRARLSSERYTSPPNANQKLGPYPLGQSQGYPEPLVQTDFDAIQQVTDVGGYLYAELDTARPHGTTQDAGLAWFVLRPRIVKGQIQVTMTNQGYVDSTQNLLYPVIALDAAGHGYMAFAVSGPSTYPTAGYMTFDGAAGPTGTIHVASYGANPLDDFSCYPPFSTGQCRYGDYSMAVASAGRIYMATEYIPPTPRDHYANWGTFVWSAPPNG